MSRFVHSTSQGEVIVDFELAGGKLMVGGQEYPCDGRNVWIEGRRVPFWTHQAGANVWVWLDGEVYKFDHRDPRQRSAADGGLADATGAVKAQMPGKVLSIGVKVGDRVKKGQSLLVMESMKMELTLEAPADAVIEAVNATAGQMVAQGELLVQLGQALD